MPLPASATDHQRGQEDGGECDGGGQAGGDRGACVAPGAVAPHPPGPGEVGLGSFASYAPERGFGRSKAGLLLERHLERRLGKVVLFHRLVREPEAVIEDGVVRLALDGLLERLDGLLVAAHIMVAEAEVVLDFAILGGKLPHVQKILNGGCVFPARGEGQRELEPRRRVIGIGIDGRFEFALCAAVVAQIGQQLCQRDSRAGRFRRGRGRFTIVGFRVAFLPDRPERGSYVDERVGVFRVERGRLSEMLERPPCCPASSKATPKLLCTRESFGASDRAWV